MTWPTISAAPRLRTRRWVPVWQNLQVSVQPTCEETQSVPRSSSGMWTRLDLLAVGEAQQPLARAVDRLAVDRDRRPADDELLGELRAEGLGERASWPRNRWRRDGRSSARAGGRGTRGSPIADDRGLELLATEADEVDAARRRRARAARIAGRGRPCSWSVGFVVTSAAGGGPPAICGVSPALGRPC